jgi:predicted aspartyl protease
MLLARSLSSILLVLLLILAGCGDASPPNCSLVKVAHTTLQIEHGLPLLPVVINGHPVWMIADSGAERSILTAAAVSRLGLEYDIGHISQTTGIGGPSTNWDVTVGELTLGGVRFPVERFAVGRFSIGDDTPEAPVGLLGADVLLAFDLDIDVPHNTLTLYRARHCPDARPPWSETAMSIPGVISRKDRLLVPVTLDGITAMAVMDTGAQNTTIGSELAERLGITDDTMEADPVIMQHGAGPTAIASHMHQFDRVEIGPATIVAPKLTVVPSGFGVGDAVVGQDFLQGRRVWISFATKQIFVTPLPSDGLLVTAH